MVYFKKRRSVITLILAVYFLIVLFILFLTTNVISDVFIQVVAKMGFGIPIGFLVILVLWLVRKKRKIVKKDNYIYLSNGILTKKISVKGYQNLLIEVFKEGRNIPLKEGIAYDYYNSINNVLRLMFGLNIDHRVVMTNGAKRKVVVNNVSLEDAQIIKEYLQSQMN